MDLQTELLLVSVFILLLVVIFDTRKLNEVEESRRKHTRINLR